MSVMEQLMEKSRISRRGFLQAAGALSATAALYGCGGGEAGDQAYNDSTVVPKDNLVFDKEMKVITQGHTFNCGSRCNFKFYLKNGRMLKLASGGDIPRDGAYSDANGKDESINLPQRRACPRGYGQIKRTYQPDRLKYPMMQTKKRGDLTGFKRISWSEAFDRIAAEYKTTLARKDKLGYIPGMGGVFSYLGPSLMLSGAPSYENLSMAKYGATGLGVNENYTPDILNSKFIIITGVAAATSFSWIPHIFWFLTKAKEKGIPIISIDPEYTDSSANLTLGYQNIPQYLSIRPESDAALLAAMAFVIYDNNLVDHTFLTNNCHGYYPGQKTGDYTTPPGMSFVEYLEGLRTTYGNKDGVVRWAADKTGISGEIIEKLAITYATVKPAALLNGYGAARTGNGFYYVWLSIALAAMTGNTDKRGGGMGCLGFDGSRKSVVLGATNEPICTVTPSPTIAFSANQMANVILNGVDSRHPMQLRDDVLTVNKIDIGEWKAARDDVNGKDGRLRLEMIAWGGNNLNQRGALTDKLIAIEKVRFMYCMDHFITPTMAYSDIILPQTTHLEEDRIEDGYGVVPYAISINKLIEPMYETKTADEINAEILKRLGINYGIYGPRGNKTQKDLLKEQWSKATIGPKLAAINPDAKLPTFEEFREKGIYELPVPPEKAPLGYSPELVGTETKKINFFSHRYYERDKALHEQVAANPDYYKTLFGADFAGFKREDGWYYRSKYPPKPMYARPYEGYEDILDGKVGLKGKKYTLQMKTAHARERAHSVYDNVAVIKDQFTFNGTQSARMNATDAAERGISNGDLVYIYNDWGCIKIRMAVSKRLARGVINVADGGWYRPSPDETYEAFIDIADASYVTLASMPTITGVTYEIRDVFDKGLNKTFKRVIMRKRMPVDVGGAPNTCMHNADINTKDPRTGFVGDNDWNGHLVEVSKYHPESK